jgi:hypothetical protein
MAMETNDATPTVDRREMTPEELRRAVRAGELLAATTPGAPRGAIAPDGLPRVARLVGREAALETTLAALAASGPPPSLALIGPVGVGKSALAAEVVARAAERDLFPGGVLWLACEELSGDPGLAHIRGAVAQALGDPPDPPGTDDEGVRRPLLALDSVEPALDASALLDALAPWRAAILLTARGSPQDARVRDAPLASLDAAANAELVQYVLRQTDPGRPVGADMAALPNSLSDGASPLALSLGAALAAVMGLPLERVADHTDAPRASVNATWLALPAAVRRAWAALALIEGATFPRGAALAVVGSALLHAAGVSRDGLHEAGLWRARGAETLDALIGLRLVSPLAAGRLTLGRFLRQFAVHQAGRADPENDSEDVVYDAPGEALASWWLAFARAQTGHEGAAALAAEASGLLGALAWARAHERHQMLLDLAEIVIPAWRAADRPAALRHALAWSVEATRALDDPPQLRRLLHDLALLDARSGRLALARASYAEALRLATEQGDAQAVALERRGLATLDAAASESPEET